MCIFLSFTCNINTTILTNFVQYPNIDQIMLCSYQSPDKNVRN